MFQSFTLGFGTVGTIYFRLDFLFLVTTCGYSDPENGKCIDLGRITRLDLGSARPIP